MVSFSSSNGRTSWSLLDPPQARKLPSGWLGPPRKPTGSGGNVSLAELSMIWELALFY